MYILSKNEQERLDFFQSLYQNAKNNLDDSINDMRLWREQYEGSDAIDGSTERACAVRNITYELIESQVSSEIPSARTRPRSWSEVNGKCAKAVERLCNTLRDRLPFERMNDEEERYTYIFGSSIKLVEWDESVYTHYTCGDIKITLVSPEDFFPQPYICREEDLEYFFVRFTATKDDLIRTYGITRDEARKASVEADAHGYAVSSVGEEDEGEIATVVVCYYRDADDLICKFVWSGDVVLSDIHDYYARKRNVCTKCGRAEKICTCDSPKIETVNLDYEELDKDIIIDGKVVIPSMQEVVRDDGKLVMETVDAKELGADGLALLDEDGLPMIGETKTPKMRKTRIPYYKPKTLPIVIRRNTSKDNSLFGQSDAAFIRPQQQQINKIESRIHQKLMRAGITPVLPEDARITLNNSIFGEVLKLRHGESMSDYGTLDTQPNISQDVAQSERVYQHARQILGITKSYQGYDDTTAKSGVAKRAQIEQSAGRLESKRQMKRFSYSQLDRICFEFHLAYADEPRPISFRDEFGRMHNDAFNRYAFVRRDEETGDYFYNDEYIFSTDASGALEEQREAMWDINRQNLIDGAFGPVGDPGTNLRYWQAQVKAHYPDAETIVEYWQKMYNAANQQAMAANMANAAANDPAILEKLREIAGGKNGGVTNV